MQEFASPPQLDNIFNGTQPPLSAEYQPLPGQEFYVDSGGNLVQNPIALSSPSGQNFANEAGIQSFVSVETYSIDNGPSLLSPESFTNQGELSSGVLEQPSGQFFSDGDVTGFSEGANTALFNPQPLQDQPVALEGGIASEEDANTAAPPSTEQSFLNSIYPGLGDTLSSFVNSVNQYVTIYYSIE
jgi:hypothetical protein